MAPEPTALEDGLRTELESEEVELVEEFLCLFPPPPPRLFFRSFLSFFILFRKPKTASIFLSGFNFSVIFVYIKLISIVNTVNFELRGKNL